MNAGSSYGVAGPTAADCCFPACDRAAVTEAGMCDTHRRVAISSTGSWLEAS